MTRRNPPIDTRIVDALCRGIIPARPATPAERLAAITHLARNGYTDPQIGHMINRSTRTVLRLRHAHHIEGQPVGTNGHTRRRAWPLESRSYRK